MFFPLGTDRRLKRPTLTTYALIAVNVVVFAWQMFYERSDPRAYLDIQRNLWLVRDSFDLHGLVTYQFLHGGMMHLLGNMLFLYVFGPNVEDRLGRLGFFAFYILGGVFAGLAHMAFSRSAVIGASGSISAVTGAYLALFPRTQLRVLLMFFYIGVLWIPAWWLIALAIAKDLVFSGFANDNVARMAHLGGYAYGLIVCLALLWWKVLPRETYDLFSIGRQAKRRRAFRELASKGDTPWADAPAKRLTREENDKRSALEEAAMDERSQISALVSEGDLGAASERYRKALDCFPKFALSRADLIAIGNHLYADAQYQLASAAYENLIARFPADVEAPRTTLMLAIMNARYLNDPVRAKQLLEKLKGGQLGDHYEQMIATLKEELG